MNSFPKFLIQSKYVTEEQALDAWVKQVSGVVSVAEVIFAKKLLSPADQLKIIEMQVQSNMDYISASMQLGFWSESIESAVRKHLAKEQKPIGTILIETNALTYPKLISALDDYILECEEFGKLPTPPARELRLDAPLRSVDAVVPEVKVSKSPDNGPTLTELYTKLYSQYLYDLIDSSIDAISAVLKPDVDDLLRIILPLEVGSKFVKAELSHKIFYSLAVALINIRRSCFLNNEAAQQFSRDTKDALKISWSVREYFGSGGTDESSYFKEAGETERALMLIQNMQGFGS